MNLASLEEARVKLQDVSDSALYSVTESGIPGKYNLEAVHSGYALVEEYSGSKELAVEGDYLVVQGHLLAPVQIEPVDLSDIKVLQPKKFAFKVSTIIMVEAISEEEAWEGVHPQARESLSDFDYERSEEDDQDVS